MELRLTKEHLYKPEELELSDAELDALMKS